MCARSVSVVSEDVICARQPPERQKRLLCRYGHGAGSVRLLYAPIKEQDEWDNPPIVRYLNIISDQEIDIIKRLSRPKVIEECCHCYCCESILEHLSQFCASVVVVFRVFNCIFHLVA